MIAYASTRTAFADHLPASYLHAILSVLQQEPPLEGPDFFTQDVKWQLQASQFVLAQQDLPGKNPQDCLKAPPEDLPQELVKSFVVEVPKSWVCHLVLFQLSVSSLQG